MPQDAVDRMCTSALLETCLRYPFNISYLAFNTPQVGFETVASRSNVYRSLLKRPDAWVETLRVYGKFDLKLEKATSLEAADAAIEVSWIELLLSQPELLRPAGCDGRRAVLRTALVKFHEREETKRPESFSLALEKAAVLMARIIEMDAPEQLTKIRSEKLERVISSADFLPDSDRLYVLDVARQLALIDCSSGRMEE